MRDLVKEIEEASKIKKEWNESQLIEMGNYYKANTSNGWIRCDFDSGEEVCGFFQNRTLEAYVHVNFPICFATKRFIDEMREYSDRLWFVGTNDFNKDEWFVDLVKLKQIAPQIDWRTCKDAVDPDCFSVDGFKFATH